MLDRFLRWHAANGRELQRFFDIGEVGDGDEVVFGPGGDDANLRSGLSSGFDGRDDSGGQTSAPSMSTVYGVVVPGASPPISTRA